MPGRLDIERNAGGGYTNWDEIERGVEGLKNHTTIRLQQEVSK